MTEVGETMCLSEVPSQIEELRRQIETAFAESKYPGDDRLVYDASGNHLECNEVAVAFRGRHWRQVPLDTLCYHSSSLYFMTPEAYRFFLPAYLIAAAVHYEEADTIPGSVVFSLIPPADPKDRQGYQHRMNGFTSTQRNTILSFLGFLKDNHSNEDPLGNVDRASKAIRAMGQKES